MRHRRLGTVVSAGHGWTAALVMMALADVLTRLAVVWLRGCRLIATATPAATPTVQAGAGT